MLRQLVIIVALFHLSFAGAQEPIYSFFTAGHTYGSPLNPQYGLHEPFVNYFDKLNTNPTIDFGVLTGDVVVTNSADYWDSAQVDISRLKAPIKIAAGNHDVGGEFVNRFGAYYYSFFEHNDLCIVLTPSLSSWNITGDQLTFLTSTLNTYASSADHIFIFLHELIWWSPTNEYQDVEINFEPSYPGSSNYDTVIKPLLLSLDNPVTIYAGDLGCRTDVTPVMYDSFDNITLIASGMGGGIQDNLVITHVYPDTVKYELIALNNSDPNAMGEITDYSIRQDPQLTDDVDLYPNPATNMITVVSEPEIISMIHITDLNGRTVLSVDPVNGYDVEIDISHFQSGTYLIRYETTENSKCSKLIVR